MARKFKKGDIVQLKSGGPKMTVDAVDGEDAFSTTGGVWAIWFAGAKRERAHFSVEAIIPVEEATPEAKKS